MSPPRYMPVIKTDDSAKASACVYECVVVCAGHSVWGTQTYKIGKMKLSYFSETSVGTWDSNRSLAKR